MARAVLVGLPYPLAVTVARLVGVEGMNMWLGQTLQLSSIFYLSPVLLTLLSICSVLLPARVTASTYDVAVDRSQFEGSKHSWKSFFKFSFFPYY